MKVIFIYKYIVNTKYINEQIIDQEYVKNMNKYINPALDELNTSDLSVAKTPLKKEVSSNYGLSQLERMHMIKK